VCGEGGAQQELLGGQYVRVVRAEAREEVRRALDICEEKGDGPTRKGDWCVDVMTERFICLRHSCGLLARPLLLPSVHVSGWRCSSGWGICATSCGHKRSALFSCQAKRAGQQHDGVAARSATGAAL